MGLSGGVSRSVEKRTKVKSRIVASALSDIIRQSDSVIIMGHRMSDYDAMGAAIGVLRICNGIMTFSLARSFFSRYL